MPDGHLFLLEGIFFLAKLKLGGKYECNVTDEDGFLCFVDDAYCTGLCNDF